MVRTIVQLTEEQATALKVRSRARRVSVAALVREAVDGALLRADEEREQRVRRASAVAGSGRSGLGDLAERHDAHLANGEDGDSQP
ncbi:MAG: ribbon-helix-helix domain-containing protein [Thermoleophilaceae bacterium]